MLESKQEHKDGKMKLMAYHYAAVELRYAGIKHKDICKELMKVYQKPVRESKMREWFSKGGLLYDSYDEYCRQENDRRRGDIRQGLSKLSEEIPNILKETLFQAARNPFTGAILRDENQEILYIRNKTTNDAVRIIAELSGIDKGEAGEGSGDQLHPYFQRLEKAPMPGEKQ